MVFFYKESKSKNLFFWGEGGGGWRLVDFFTKNLGGLG